MTLKSKINYIITYKIENSVEYYLIKITAWI
jgi:hypothetical protein